MKSFKTQQEMMIIREDLLKETFLPVDLCFFSARFTQIANPFKTLN